MKTIADDLRRTIDTAVPLLDAITNDDASRPAAAGKWSRKEILGHLIDSACNNQQKFVRTMAGPHLDFVGYEQNHWVTSQNYVARDWAELIAFWRAYNLHLAHIMEHTDPSLLGNTITVEDHGTFTLEFIMGDYVEHMKHHLLQILPAAETFPRTFESEYNKSQ